MPLLYHVDENLIPVPVPNSAPGLRGQYICAATEVDFIMARDYAQVYDLDVQVNLEEAVPSSSLWEAAASVEKKAPLSRSSTGSDYMFRQILEKYHLHSVGTTRKSKPAPESAAPAPVDSLAHTRA